MKNKLSFMSIAEEVGAWIFVVGVVGGCAWFVCMLLN